MAANPEDQLIPVYYLRHPDEIEEYLTRPEG
jgi:hypothetical protein